MKMGGGLVLTRELLIECLDYNPDSGLFTWKQDRPLHHFKNEHARNTYLGKFAGKIAGYSSQYSDDLSYVQIRLFTKLYFAHRLAWLYTYGVWPENRIDHEDGNGENNRIMNLREVDAPTNGKNCSISKNNTSGVNGVYWHKQCNKWCAEGHYTENGVNKKKYLGLFTDLEDAKLARENWQNEHGGFTERHGK